MSLTFTVDVWCDGRAFGRDCNEWVHGSTGGVIGFRVGEARANVAAFGWHSGRLPLPIGGRSQKYDLCPACRAAQAAQREGEK